jgi:hypothetical protein
MSKVLLIFVPCALAAIAVWMQVDYNAAMEKCQVLHSKDTCASWLK